MRFGADLVVIKSNGETRRNIDGSKAARRDTFSSVSEMFKAACSAKELLERMRDEAAMARSEAVGQGRRFQGPSVATLSILSVEQS